jgi:hypothetical protein
MMSHHIQASIKPGMQLTMNQSPKTVLTLSVIALFLISSSAFVLAQYQTQETTPITIPVSAAGVGVFTADQTATAGVSISVAGIPGSTGSVSTAISIYNPQPGANIPTDTTLTHFVTISFNMSQTDFLGANITIHYSDSDVAAITQPFKLLKYIPESNNYIELTATSFDYTAKTATFSVSSTTDPLFAIGGTSSNSTPKPSSTATVLLIALVAVVVIVILLATLLMRRGHSK